MKRRVHGAKLLFSAGTAVTLAIGMLAVGQTAYAASPTAVNLRTAANFALLAGTTVTNTGASTITGNLGVHPGSTDPGFPPGIVNGTIHLADATALQAKSDLTTAYDDAAGRTSSTAVAPDPAGQTLVGGGYNV